MAVSSSIRLTERERFWFESRIANSTGMSLVQLKRTYWTSLGLTGTYAEQQRRWLKKLITDNLATPSSTNQVATILKEALSALGTVPSVRQTENWFKLYGTYNP